MTRDWKSAHELRGPVQWLDVYHNEQLHQALGWKTPRGTCAEDLKQRPTMAA